MLIRVLLFSLALLALVYFLKSFLLQLASDGAPGIVRQGEDLVRLGGSDGSADGNQTDLGAALEAYRDGDDAKALDFIGRCLENSASGMQEDIARAACKTALGELYLVGAGVPRNLTKAQELFQVAASLGETDAQYNLGILHASRQLEPDTDPNRHEALAVLHLYAASTAGHPGALMAMGYRHLHGYGVPQACSTAALNYIDVAKRVAGVYSSGMPQAVELVRLNLHHKDRKVVSSSELNLFVQIATSGDNAVAVAIGKRYLLGIEGMRQDYSKAKHYLRMAANRQHPGALALLGYMHCLGLGTPPNLDTAYAYFVTAASHNDPLGHNGLGYIYFKGTNTQARNYRLAFKHFNESAVRGSSDGMFNLASMYLTGTGTEQSFQKAVLFYTQALDRGHTPAAYSLAIMHLNGIGTVRDCDIAVKLLKKVCERGDWVSSKLVSAYEFGENEPDKAALLFLKLAEAGHEVSQMNAAHLFDSGQSTLLSSNAGSSTEEPASADEGSSTAEVDTRSQGRNFAQRFYELSAEQGSASSELRLGDYAYYGWGMSASFSDSFSGSTSSLRGGDVDDAAAQVAASSEEDQEAWDDFPLPSIYTNDRIELKPQAIDYEASLVRYRKTADMTVTGEWMQPFVARASFNLGFMHQFGIGISQDMHMAKQHYFRCREVDPAGVHAPVGMALAALAGHVMYLRMPEREQLARRLLSDFRVHVLILHMTAALALALLRCYLPRLRGARPRSQRPTRAESPRPALSSPATEPAGEVPQGEAAQGVPTSTAAESRRAAGNLVLD
eukprot:gb/GFBE01017113.1/.p1 GENE.gb/GFBE01017113.1/~~gb/GFBE01017113.1/.p1  ORF type:complete len:786 (+),score=154.08 gb/GFBE01017113.1/:1-2358(+)